ncbi:hypothetical protein FNB79_15170 [Formosa sediminum]|uniref:RteC protein n=1 Tax=Formosa sediminum TaxID=2594004 RepID=A0A516GUR4_9FLAO|nr:RteC domain-containing protein [Formosa sediminum]QDO95257.1 hypothetical protein FNB79_15170 [Formosa sediminum]
MKQTVLNNFQEELIRINNSSLNTTERANRSIISCRKTLGALKKEVLLKGFKSTQQEIIFFKHTKSVPLKELIYYLKLRSFELQLPRSGKELQCKIIKRKLNKLNRFFLRNIDFGQYMESECTHLDEYYYTRPQHQEDHYPFSKLYYEDFRFSTPKGLLLAEFKAYSAFMLYLENRLFCIKNPLQEQEINTKLTKKLVWPFGYAAFVELISVLSAAELHTKNNLSIIDLARKFQEIIDIQNTGFYNTRNENANRTKGLTPFLDSVILAYIKELDKKNKFE